MTAYLSCLLISVRFGLLAALTLIVIACGGPDPEATGTGGSGGVGGATDCLSDRDCVRLHGDGFECGFDGECYECESHIDPFGGPVDTPEFWDAEQFESGAELGLDPQRAYWEIRLDEYGLQNQPPPSPVWICNPMTLQDGEVVSTASECETLSAEEFIHESHRLIVPVAPSAWLSSDPLNGLYYTEVSFEFGPIPVCD